MNATDTRTPTQGATAGNVWPAPPCDWKDTLDTLHIGTQIAGAAGLVTAIDLSWQRG